MPFTISIFCTVLFLTFVYADINTVCNQTTFYDWNDANLWLDGQIPTPESSVIISDCKIIVHGSITVRSLRLAEGSHLIIGSGRNVSVTDGTFITEESALSFLGTSSVLMAGSGLFIDDGVITGTLTVIGNVTCAPLCQIDVFTWPSLASAQVDYTGRILIQGNLLMRMGTSGANVSESNLPHSVIVLGLYHDATNQNNSYSKLRVTGKLFIEKLHLMCAPCGHYYPSSQLFASPFPNDAVVAQGGIVLVDLIDEDGQKRLFARSSNTSNSIPYSVPPFPSGVHTGRFRNYSPSSTPIPGFRPDPSLVLGPGASGCSQIGSNSLTILFSGSSGDSCPYCASGFVYSSASLSCIPSCPDPTCSGHGSCILNAAQTSFYCNCSFGWTGTQCSLPNCPLIGGNVCNLRGTCLAPISAGAPALCECLPGYIPPDCITFGSNGSIVCGSTQCGRAAVGCTQSGACECLANFTGSSCETPQCPNQCSSNGQCDGSRLTPVCSCTGSWIGQDCSIVGEGGSPSASEQLIAGIARTTFIGVISAVSALVLLAIALILLVRFNKKVRGAIRPYSKRNKQVDTDDAF